MERNQTVDILKALADEMRLSIVKKLAQERAPVSSCDVVEACATMQQLSQPAMSHHFNKLVESGVLLQEKRGTKKVYSLNEALLDRVGIDVTKF